ncbi:MULTISPECIES: hypothetical protein [unclassified Streptomyces]|uniref:hypothetical protein n=1 Tax=unclassified Streptomyces TaxID=2593676 RepID=UPI0011B93EB2|nr:MULTISPECIES: hypothetical protein [unclassified Streptomyces]
MELRLHPGFTEKDDADTAAVEKELRRRLDMISGQDDVVIALGLMAAGRWKPEGDERAADRIRYGRGSLDLEAEGIPAADFAHFQRLWYWFKVPHGEASLVWWYMFCRALGQEDGVGRALRRMTRWLGVMEREPDPGTMPALAREMGLPNGAAVVTEAETTDVDALAFAVRDAAPLVPALHRRDVLWHGRRVTVGRLEEAARRSWDSLPDGERAELLAVLGRRVTSVERVRLLVDGALLDNRGVAASVADCAKEQVAAWPESTLALMTLLRCWHEAGFVLQETNQSLVSFPALALFMTRKGAAYGNGLAGEIRSGLEDGDLVRYARNLGALRLRTEQRYERCLHFDGSNWERREFLLPRGIYRREQSLPESLCEHLYARTGAEPPARGGTGKDWDTFLERVLEAGSTPTRVIQECAHWAANTDDLPVDIAVFTAPLGTRLDEPWTMEFTDLFCYTGFREGYDPAAFGVTAGRVGMYNIIAQRMRYNAVKKAQNYAPVMRFAPQGFNLPDIAVAEDANHGGHSAAGIRLACRLPVTVRHGGNDWNGLADVRLNRCVYSPENRFRPQDMVIGHRYAQWAKGIADATYRRNLTFDVKWARKVTDLTP